MSANSTALDFEDGDFQRLYDGLNRTDFGAAVADAAANVTDFVAGNVTALLANETVETTTSIYFQVPHEDPELAKCAKIVLRSDIRVSDRFPDLAGESYFGARP